MESKKLTVLDAAVSTTTSDPNAGPRQHLIDVVFKNPPVAVHYISFCNHYSSAITVSHSRSEAGQSMPSWQVVIAKQTLMADPHCEDDAQCYHELTSAHFDQHFDSSRVHRLRICCIQPSPSWCEYGLRQLRFYTLEQPVPRSLQQLPSLTEFQRERASTITEQLLGLGHISSLLGETIASAAVSTRSGRNGQYKHRGRRAQHDVHVLAPYLVGEWSDELRLPQRPEQLHLAAGV